MRSTYLLLPLLLHGIACDRFYVVQGTVTDCITTEPIAGASVALELDQGDEVDRYAGQTDEAGKFSAVLNAPASDRPSTLTVQKTDHDPLTVIVHDPENAQQLCLKRSGGSQ